MRPALYPVLFRRPLRGGPTLDLNFAASGTLDPRVTYSGASLATLTDSAGNIAYKPHNLALYSEALANAAYNAFATTVSSGATTPPAGFASADKLQEGSGIQLRGQSMAVVAGQRYTQICRAKLAERSFLVARNQDSTRWCVVNLSDGTLYNAGSGFSVTITPIDGGWFEVACSFVSSTTGNVEQQWGISATGTLSSGSYDSYTGTAGYGLYITGIQWCQGAKTAYSKTTSAAYFGPRFTYDPVTLSALGLLIEEQRTNLLLQSNSLSTTWSAFGSAGVSQNITGIDGGTTGWTLTDSNAGGLAGVQQAVAVAATTYTLSAYVKKTTGAQASYPVINADNGSTRTCLATIDTSNGVATVWTAYTGWTVTTSSATCVSHNADYWRVALTFLATAVNWNIGLYAAGTANATQSTGVLSASAQGSAGFTCLQLEAGAFATSYIPTTSASVTRAADSATMTGSNFSSWFNATQGTLYVEGGGSNAAGSARLVGISDGTTLNRIINYLSGATQLAGLVSTGGVAQANPTVNVTSAASSNKLAQAYVVNNVNVAANGTLGAADTSATIPTVTLMRIGADESGTGAILNGTIARLRYYNTALTNAQLQALTT